MAIVPSSFQEVKGVSMEPQPTPWIYDGKRDWLYDANGEPLRLVAGSPGLTPEQRALALANMRLITERTAIPVE